MMDFLALALLFCFQAAFLWAIVSAISHLAQRLRDMNRQADVAPQPAGRMGADRLNDDLN